MKPKVIVTRRWPAAVEAKLAQNYDVEFNQTDTAFSIAEMQSALCSADALLTTVTDNVGANVFELANNSDIRTKVIANYGVGYSHIDINAASKHGIAVTNTPDVLSECTADIAITLMLMVARRAGEGERELRSGQWSGWRPTHLIGSKVSGATLGIVGFGRIGRETAKRAIGFGMEILVFNRSPVDPSVLAQYNAVQVETLEDVFFNSDFVSLHCPGGVENTHLVNQQLINSMKPGAYLINTARGEVIDEQALLDALEQNTIAGAGLDVYSNEPSINSRYLSLQNAVLLPHLGSATAATREAMGFRAIQNLDQFFSGQKPGDQVV
ncbi:MAG: 2-hydroxyacid dehydrogenase [Arenicella sp.]